MENILVPCDFSKPAQEAFKFAVKIAGQSKGAVHVLYVIDITFLRGHPTLSQSYAFNVNFLKDVEREATQKFQVMRGKFAPLTMEVKFKYVISSLTEEIETYIVENKIDLVLMGTHGEGNAKFGSNTGKIVRNSSVPVIALKSAPTKIENIVVPVIPDQPDKAFISKLQDLQSFFQAKLHFLYVNTTLFFKNDPDSIAELQHFASEHFSNYSINVRSDYTIEEGITHFTKEIKGDMIALGTHGWKGLAHLFIGSTAEDIVNGLKIPVYTYRLK